MPETIISALVQAPFVLVMAYLVQRFLAHMDARDKEWQEFLDQADERLAERMDRLTEAIERLSNLVITHDALTRGRGLSAHDGGEERLRAARRVR